MDEDSPKTCKILMIGFNTVFLVSLSTCFFAASIFIRTYSCDVLRQW